MLSAFALSLSLSCSISVRYCRASSESETTSLTDTLLVTVMAREANLQQKEFGFEEACRFAARTGPICPLEGNAQPSDDHLQLHLRVCELSSAWAATGLMVAITTVRALPPRLGWSRRVSFELR